MWADPFPMPRPEPPCPVELNKYGILFPGPGNRPPFFPLKLLEHIFPKETIFCELQALKKFDEQVIESLVDRILGLNPSYPKKHLKVFSILKKIKLLEKISELIELGMSDEELPVVCDALAPDSPLSYGNPVRSISDGLMTEDKRFRFLQEQHQMNIPFFYDRPEPYHFDWRAVVPYCESPFVGTTPEGSFATVTRISIHPLCHDFHGSFDKLKEEINMLQRFKKTEHTQIVTLLASFTRENENYLMFPCAVNDLRTYWENNESKTKARDPKWVEWLSYQVLGLMEAVSLIHQSPEDKDCPEEERT
ncbi:hypothetical protein F4808DRAFT_459074 [Astrocystis sublimbata]|nr:hypothetical protein F4808DRAFT_459074 [Astrocystis sublimbata]